MKSHKNSGGGHRGQFFSVVSRRGVSGSSGQHVGTCMNTTEEPRFLRPMSLALGAVGSKRMKEKVSLGSVVSNPTSSLLLPPAVLFFFLPLCCRPSNALATSLCPPTGPSPPPPLHLKPGAIWRTAPRCHPTSGGDGGHFSFLRRQPQDEACGSPELRWRVLFGIRRAERPQHRQARPKHLETSQEAKGAGLINALTSEIRETTTSDSFELSLTQLPR
ncbi:hypothetical protein EYF80_011555 [Liparis tanakae]|uniref:Uncharacterized protein n=1 Tax=Liparis tanakae TaxID=230148 RepID=A0A4Z2IKI3_9TELE|nr:hypothetical protein EYF80_011555 [Liparis tanakae]